jgi:hypothetical protein
VIIVVSIVGIVSGEDAASGQISVAISDLVGPQAAAAVEEAVRRSRLEEAGFVPTILGVGALIFGATTVFAQMQRCLLVRTPTFRSFARKHGTRPPDDCSRRASILRSSDKLCAAMGLP